MVKLILFLICLFFVCFCVTNKVRIKFKSFFRKGFKINNDTYRLLLLHRQTTGLGKTYSVIDFIYSLGGNYRVITNVLSFAKNNPKFVIYEPNFYKIIDGFTSGKYDTNYIIFFDEIFTLLEKGKLDKSILSFISQLRKRRLYLVTTAQEWLEINVTFRRYVRYQIDCKMWGVPLGGCALSINEINDGYAIQWDNLQNEYVAPRLKTTIKKCSKKYADSYDTYEVIKTS